MGKSLNETHSFSPTRPGLGELGNENRPWANVFADKLTLTGGSSTGSSSTMSADESITDPKTILFVYFRDPNGAQRNITLSGSWRTHSMIIIVNTGTDYSIYLNNTVSGGNLIQANEACFLIYDGSTWRRFNFA